MRGPKIRESKMSKARLKFSRTLPTCIGPSRGRRNVSNSLQAANLCWAHHHVKVFGDLPQGALDGRRSSCAAASMTSIHRGVPTKRTNDALTIRAPRSAITLEPSVGACSCLDGKMRTIELYNRVTDVVQRWALLRAQSRVRLGFIRIVRSRK